MVSKKVVGTAVAILALGFLVWLGMRGKPITPPPDTSGNNASSTTGEWKTYRNEKYGFSLKIPDSWENYKATVHEYGQSSDYYADVCFSFDAPRPPFCFFQITIFTQNQWKEALQKDPSIEYFRREGGDFFFSPESASESGKDPCIQLDEFLCARKRDLFSKPINIGFF